MVREPGEILDVPYQIPEELKPFERWHNNKKFLGQWVRLRRLWAQLYPEANITECLRDAYMWEETHETQRKTHISRYLSNWVKNSLKWNEKNKSKEAPESPELLEARAERKKLMADMQGYCGADITDKAGRVWTVETTGLYSHADRVVHLWGDMPLVKIEGVLRALAKQASEELPNEAGDNRAGD